MRRHPDELVGRYRLGDTGSIRRYFEANPAEFEVALDTYRAWKRAMAGSDEAFRLRDELEMLGRNAGASWGDWSCVLMTAVRRQDLGLAVPPWHE